MRGKEPLIGHKKSSHLTACFVGAKGSTQNFLFLFIFNKLKILSRFVHVLYKNGRQKAVFT